MTADGDGVVDVEGREGASARRWRAWHGWVLGIGLVAVVGLIFLFVVPNWGVLCREVNSWWRDVGKWWHGDGWPWISNWLTTAGFGGFAAVVAASLAFSGARHQARLSSWWQRAEWALNLYTKPDAEPLERRAGVAAVEALQRSRLAKKDEKRFLTEVATAVTFDPNGDGIENDDWSAAESGSAPQKGQATAGPSVGTSNGADAGDESSGDGDGDGDGERSTPGGSV